MLLCAGIASILHSIHNPTFSATTMLRAFFRLLLIEHHRMLGQRPRGVVTSPHFLKLSGPHIVFVAEQFSFCRIIIGVTLIQNTIWPSSYECCCND